MVIHGPAVPAAPPPVLIGSATGGAPLDSSGLQTLLFPLEERRMTGVE